MNERTDPSDAASSDGGAAAGSAAEDAAAVDAAWRRRKRLAEIFGDAMPSSTSDDRDPEESSRSQTRASEEWLKRQVPPHHG